MKLKILILSLTLIFAYWPQLEASNFNFYMGLSHMPETEEEFRINGIGNIPDFEAKLSGFNIFMEIAPRWNLNQNLSILLTGYFNLGIYDTFKGNILARQFDEQATDIEFGMGLKPLFKLNPGGPSHIALWVKPRLGFRSYNIEIDEINVEGDNFVYGLGFGIDYRPDNQNYTFGPYFEYDLNNKRKKIGLGFNMAL